MELEKPLNESTVCLQLSHENPIEKSAKYTPNTHIHVHVYCAEGMPEDENPQCEAYIHSQASHAFFVYTTVRMH